MIVASHGSSLEVRAPAEFGTSIVPAPGTGGWPYSGWSWAGRVVSTADALGLSAVASCIRLLAQQVACMPFTVYSGPKNAREPMPDSWQQLLLDDPSPDWDSFSFIEDIVSSLESTGNAFVQKVRGVGKRSAEVVELRPLDPDIIRVRIVNGQKVIQVWNGAKTSEETKQILHIRGWVNKPSPTGVGSITLHQNAIGSALALEEYEGRYFQNDARPSVVISTTGRLTSDQRRELRDGFEQKHQGASRSHGVGILDGGATISPLSPALRETQAVELRESALREACRMFGIPDLFLGAVQKPTNQTPEAEFARLFRISLLPRVRRIEANFAQDPDLFGGSGLAPRFDPTEILRADTATTAAVIHNLVQVGVLTANEGRSMLGMPAHDDPKANELLATPVGAGANADAGLNGSDPSAALAAITPGGDQ